MSESVLIIMAVYNSERFIREQLNSIINQNYKNWNLIIRDDNSCDNTIKIIQEYSQKDKRINIITNRSNKHGAYYNFHTLINECKNLKKYDYYMFADHDDIWLPDKIEDMLIYFKLHTNSSVPSLLYGDMKIIDENSTIVLDSINKVLGIRYKNRISTFFSHSVFGCNTLFNYALFNIVPAIDTSQCYVNFLSHDNFYAKYAAIKGKVMYYDKTVMLYRRYANNVTAKHEYEFTIKRIFKRIFKFSELAKDHALTYKQSLCAIDIMRKNGLSIEEENIVEKIQKGILIGGLYSIGLILKYRISWGKPVKTISRSLVLITEIYKKYL
ncbi:glycosyltransferase [Clostridium lundense]|uniref:glycosyltransferase n=1 Tax=Clostridium lundense TaxID=319475 RepID=UPI00048210FA|nr:glycosyltransferase [Clostridium lundense]